MSLAVPGNNSRAGFLFMLGMALAPSMSNVHRRSPTALVYTCHQVARPNCTPIRTALADPSPALPEKQLPRHNFKIDIFPLSLLNDIPAGIEPEVTL